MRGLRYVSSAGWGGYELAAQGYLRALVGAGLAVEWVPIFLGRKGWRTARTPARARKRLAPFVDPRDREGCDFGMWAQDLIGRDVEPDATVLHTVPELWPDRLGRGQMNVGNTVWETDRLPKQWPSLFAQVDRLIVPSRFNADLVDRAGVDTPTEVVPHILTARREEPDPDDIACFRRERGIPPDHRVVYCTDAWNARKAPWKTITCFLRAFTGREPVTLVLKTTATGPRSALDHGRHPTSDLVAELVARTTDPAHIVVIDDAIGPTDMEMLHHAADCYLSLSHGEGFGLGPFHAAAAGNPVVTVRWGGVLDFLTPDWPYLVDCDPVPVMNAGGLPSYQPDQNWASADLDHAIELIRAVIDDPERARARVAPTIEWLRSAFSLEAVGPRLVDAIT